MTKQGTILIVDDNELSRSILSGMLREFQLDPVSAASVGEAVRLCRDAAREGRPYRVALVDWLMPGMNGKDTAQAICAALPKRPVILFMATIHDRPDVLAHIREGKDIPMRLITKPVTPSSLISALLEAEQPQDRPDRAEPSAAPFPELVGARVLLAEDNAINRQVANEILQSSGVSVEPAGDGLEAVEKLWEGGYDAVLMDIQMPGMDGLKATRILREYARFDNLPIIAMTAHAMNGDREKSLSVGMQDYIAKPIEPSVLLSTLARDTPGRPLSPALSAAPRYPMHQPEHTPRTLFVDDESINQQIGAEILLALGAEADTADNGLQALRLIRTRHYAIVFTDVEMPVMDGATLTHILRSDSRYGELPIIACTAISSPEEEEALLQKGFTAVLRKPFDVQAMQTALNRHATLSGEAPAPSPEPRPRVEAGHAIREELEHLPGFSVRQGLDRVMGNLPLYVSLLFDFRRELAEADAEIRQARLRDDMPSIRASVHKLKGISGNVGATDLYTQLVELEQCLQGGSAENVGNLLDTLYGYVTTTESVLAAAGQAIAAYPL